MQTKNLLLLTALTTGATFVSLAPSAQAAILWHWTYTQSTGNVVDSGNGSGTFTTEDTPLGGPFLITAITGSFDNLGTITNLLAPGTFGGNDNLINSTGELTSNGVSFTTDIPALNTQYNLFKSAVLGYQVFAGNPSTNNSLGTFSATIVPEPLTLMGASAAIAFGAAFKRRRA